MRIRTGSGADGSEKLLSTAAYYGCDQSTTGGDNPAEGCFTGSTQGTARKADEQEKAGRLLQLARPLASSSQPLVLYCSGGCMLCMKAYGRQAKRPIR